jgi:hypothetical protein
MTVPTASLAVRQRLVEIDTEHCLCCRDIPYPCWWRVTLECPLCAKSLVHDGPEAAPEFCPDCGGYEDEAAAATHAHNPELAAWLADTVRVLAEAAQSRLLLEATIARYEQQNPATVAGLAAFADLDASRALDLEMVAL